MTYSGFVLKKTDDMTDYDAFVKRVRVICDYHEQFGTLPMYEDLSVVVMDGNEGINGLGNAIVKQEGPDVDLLQ